MVDGWFQKTGFFKDDEFLKQTGVMFVASAVGGVCNYVYQLYMGRALGPKEYGVFGSLFALSYIMFVLSGTVQTSGARFVSKFVGEGKTGNISYLLRGLLKRMFFVGLVVFLFFVFGSGWISRFLNIESVLPVVIVGCVFLFSLLLPVNLGVLQGLQRFGWLGSSGVVNFGFKLLFGVLFVGVGFGVSGALGALVVASVVALVFSFVPLRSVLSVECRVNPGFDFSELYRYSFPTLVAMFCFAVPANVDVIVVKHFFDAHSAGLYTAVSVLGKIVLFLPGAVVAVMFPKVSRLNATGKMCKGVLNRSLLYVAGLSGVFAVGYWFFPQLAVRLPFGSKYVGAASIVGLYGVAIFFFSLTVVLMRYSLAIHDLKYVYVFTFFTLLEIVLFVFFHETLEEVVMVLLLVNLVLFVFSYCFVNRQKWFFGSAIAVDGGGYGR